MADIQLRFDKDILVLTGPVQQELMRLGTDTQRDSELTMLLEPEVFEDVYKLQQFTGVQCFVANTTGLTPARLAHAGMREQGEHLAKVALDIVNRFNPQHVLVEIAPCGLPLDAASKQSLNENCDQYKRAAQLFDHLQFDAFFLNGFAKCADLKCALIGIRKVSDAPIFASVNVDGDGVLAASEWAQPLPSGESLKESVQIMAEYEAQVVGFSTAAAPEQAVALAEQVRQITYLPMLVQLDVVEDVLRSADPVGVETCFDPPDSQSVMGIDVGRETGFPPRDPQIGMGTDVGIDARIDPSANDNATIPAPTPSNPYPAPDTMFPVADALCEAGVQFLRATGAATPAYTGALVAATEGRDVVVQSGTFGANSGTIDEPLEDVAERLRKKVNAAIK